MNYSLPGSIDHGILQALEWDAISFSGNGNKEPVATSFFFFIDEKNIYSEF